MDGQTYGFVSFSTESVEVQEDSGNTVTTVQLPMVREVGTTGTILATVEVTYAGLCALDLREIAESMIVAITFLFTTCTAPQDVLGARNIS